MMRMASDTNAEETTTDGDKQKVRAGAARQTMPPIPVPNGQGHACHGDDTGRALGDVAFEEDEDTQNVESADGEVEVHWDVEGEPANAVGDGDLGCDGDDSDADEDSLGVFVDEIRCLRCSGMFCSLSGKPVCYKCRDRCS